MKNENDVAIGDRVVMIDGSAHKQSPKSFPPVGIIGTVQKLNDNEQCLIDWNFEGLANQRMWCDIRRVCRIYCNEEPTPKELIKSAESLMEFLHKYYDSHHYAIVTQGTVEITSGVLGAHLTDRD